jgi:hypothetical protein
VNLVPEVLTKPVLVGAEVAVVEVILDVVEVGDVAVGGTELVIVEPATRHWE